MPKIYEYVRHPRFDQLHAMRPLKTRDLRNIDHPNWLVRFNARVGLRVTLIVGTMWTAYLFTAIALVALPSSIHQGLYFVIVWLSSSFLQLVLLPIIIVGQNIQAKAADQRAEDTFKDAEAVLKEAQEIQNHLLAQDEAISSILEHVRVAAVEPTPAVEAGPRGPAEPQ